MKFLENSKNKTILRIRMLVNTGPGHLWPLRNVESIIELFTHVDPYDQNCLIPCCNGK